MKFVFENPPLLQSEDGKITGEYLARAFLAAKQAFDGINDFEEASPFQGTPQNGMLRYSEGDSTDFTSGAGFYWYYNNQWNNLSGEVLTYGALISGTGNVWDDLNAQDFSGEEYAGVDGCASTALSIKTNAIVIFGHNNISYVWIGPGGVCVGIGGTYSAVSSDLAPIGTGDHSVLTNRDAADSHPQSAIGGRGSAANLESDQIQQDSNLQNHISDGNNPHGVRHEQLPDVNSDANDPHPMYQLKTPGMLLGGTADSFTLNTTDSKLVNYSISAQWNWSDDDDINPTDGEITIPEDGIYDFNVHVIGTQGNDTKEEEITLKFDVVGGTGAGRYDIDYREVATDKTSNRSLGATFSRPAYENQVCSLYMHATADLGTFTITRCTFEALKMANINELS